MAKLGARGGGSARSEVKEALALLAVRATELADEFVAQVVYAVLSSCCMRP